MVENLKTSLSLQNRIVERLTKRGTKNFVIQFGDKAFYTFLNQIGITPAKSKTIKHVKIPNQFFHDFLRGFFDGDGTFYTFWDKRWPSSFGYQISFASASSVFIKWLQIRLKQLYHVKGFIRIGDGVFNLRYVKGDSRKLFSVMYHTNGLFLKRKYDKIINALEQDDKIRKIRRASSAEERRPEEARVPSSTLGPGTGSQSAVIV